MADLAKLESVAQQLAGRIREDGMGLALAWLAAELPDPADWLRLNGVLACAVPTDRSWKDLTGWARGEPSRRAYHRDYARRRDPAARRAYQRAWAARKRARREAHDASPGGPQAA